MRNKVLIKIRILILSLVLLLTGNLIYGQQLIAYWNFNEGANGTPWSAPIIASSGSGTITAGTWTWNNLDYTDGFAGNTQNALFGDPAGASLSLRSNLMNGNYIQFEFSMTGLENLEISYWTRGTSSGFNSNQWSWSSDGVNFTNFGDPIVPSTASSGGVIEISAPSSLNGVANAYLRYTLDGATGTTGNNRIDNLQLNAIQPGAILPPANLNAEAISTSQINLDWNLNSNNNNVLLAWSANGVFGEPTGTYNVGDPISGGGTVLYFGSATSINHTGLAAGTTYYYKAWSKSGNDYSVGITTSETTFPDPATTTLPYTETFDADLGDCYVFSVSGPSKFWNHGTFSGNGFAQMNGFNSGDIEQDWLILPGINLDNYINEVLSFETWWRYGTDDANNYLKLFYSANYSGTGDPTSATWTELSFTKPAAEQTWTGSGNIDLSGISGSMVYIGFKYNYEAGNYRWWQVDNISITGTPTGTIATKLSVPDVNNGVSPSVNTAFEVTVTALNDDNVPAAVSEDTPVTLSRATGTGTLGGTLSGTILAGQTSVTIGGVTYNIAEAGVSISASATGLTSGTSDPFNVLAAANHLAFVDVPAYGQISTPLAPFTVEARRPDNTVDLNFTGTITLSKASGPGTIAGTLILVATQGVVEFIDIEFDELGSYTMQAASGSLTNAVSPVVAILGEPQIEAVIIPQYMMGNNPGNHRLPFAFRATFSNLIPNAIYKYTNQVVIDTDGPTSAGAGNAIYVTLNGDFLRATGTSFSNPEQHYEFTTNANGAFTGWFVTEPTGNARFTPGNTVFMRIRLNDGDGGTSPMHYLTIAESVMVLGLGTDNDPLQGSGVYGKHFSQGKNFALLYDNTAGTGRPLSASFIENDGTTGGTAYPVFYQDNVDGLEGSWGSLIPNQLANGLQRVEVRDRLTGNIIDGTTTVPNGIWPYGSNTVNPATGATGMLITPWPDFVASALNVSPGTTITFTDLTLGSPTAWNWEFFGGTPGTSILQNPSIIYYNSGEFDVTLEVTTEFGTETITKTEYINVNPLPWPDFEADITIVTTGGSVEFTDLSTGEPTSWLWTFEGGTPATYNGQNPPAIVYDTPGTYFVTLEVTNQWGSNSMTKEEYITVGDAPVADFEADATGIIEGNPVNFTDLSQHEPTAWEWTFDGGTPSSSTLQNPVVIYNTPGVYSVSLKVSNPFGEDILTKTDYITVNPVGIKTPETARLSIWPNPSSGLVSIRLPEAKMHIRVYNFTGKMVYQSTSSGLLESIDLNHLVRGIYMIESVSEDSETILRSKLILK